MTKSEGGINRGINSAVTKMTEAYEKACEEVKTAGDWSKSIPNARKLISYGLFKQISAGDNTSSRPWAVQFEACAKHDAWESRCGAAQLMFCFF